MDTEGPWVELKKPTLEHLPVIDPRVLKAETRHSLSRTFDEISKEEIQALPRIAEDPVRAMIDAQLAAALGIKNDLSILRKLLAAEPIISMKLPG